MEALWKPPETHPPAPLPIDPGCRGGPSAAAGQPFPKREIRYSSDNPAPRSPHSRFGNGLDGRRQIGSTPAAGDVGSAEAPRAVRQAPPTYEPDEPRRPVLRERTLLFLAAEQGTAVRRRILVGLVTRDHLPAHQPGTCSGAGDSGDPPCVGGGADPSAAGAVSPTRLRFVAKGLTRRAAARRRKRLCRRGRCGAIGF